MNLILYAIPAFLLLMLAEIVLDQRRRTGFYRLNDAVASLGTGLLSETTAFATRFVGFLGYAALWALLPHPELQMTPLLWVLAFVLYDFCYYWHHRVQHKINFFWGIHVVHHQSEEYNLSTALRQPFNRLYLPPLRLERRVDARVDWHAVHMHGTDAALRFLAADLGAGQLQVLAHLLQRHQRPCVAEIEIAATRLVVQQGLQLIGLRQKAELLFQVTEPFRACERAAPI